jgi:hypothetical protein
VDYIVTLVIVGIRFVLLTPPAAADLQHRHRLRQQQQQRALRPKQPRFLFLLQGQIGQRMQVWGLEWLQFWFRFFLPFKEAS